jgi:hypothetical protein
MDLERQVQLVWDPTVRPLVLEAWRCYSGGAIRASIGMTWVAVCADLTAKIVRLAEDGEGQASDLATKVVKAREAGLSAAGVATMQEVERTVINTAVKLDIIDSIGARELERIREDRNLCVHPSLRGHGDAYVPLADVARAHLALALDTVLVHPPTQGRRLVEAFLQYVAETTYVPSPTHTLATFFDRVHPRTKRNIIQAAAKHALLELEGPDTVNKRELADRMADCLSAFATKDRAAVAEALGALADRFQSAGNEILINAVGRLGPLPEFWEIFDEGQAERLNNLLPTLKGIGQETWTFVASPAVLAMVAEQTVRARLPLLETTFSELTQWQRREVMAARPNTYFAPLVPTLLDEALSFRGAEEITATVVVPHGSFLTIDQLRAALRSWANNNQCREASAMPELAVALYRATAHLRPDDQPVWNQFLTDVRSHLTGNPAMADYEDFYSYRQLEAAAAADER